MSETPRLRSAFPTTPRTQPASRTFDRNARPVFSSSQTSQTSSARSSPITRPVKDAPSTVPVKNMPVIPLQIVDGPSQRLYAAAFYCALFAWKLWDAYGVSDDLDSTWLFLKWMSIDAAFFVALPAVRIPWMEFSFATTLSIWLIHAVADAFFMYHIPIPISAWLGAIVKVAYDRELSISEHRVKPGDILHNASIILGKQIIQILPEGTAILNPNKQSFCLDSSIRSIDLPIQVNQTIPAYIELLRYDVETDEVETVVINSKQAKQLNKQAEKAAPKLDIFKPRVLRYPVTKTGVYHLQRVVDESKLDVRKRSYDVAVVPCPQATVTAQTSIRCTGDLTDVVLSVVGVPPLKVKYSKRINHQQFASIVQSVEPDDFELIRTSSDPDQPNTAWARSASVSLDISESLHQNGTWVYNIEEVEDSLGNKVRYDTEKSKKSPHAPRYHALTVHHRPKISLLGCDANHPLRVAQEETVNLPIAVRPSNQLHSSDWPLQLSYSFVAEEDTQVTTGESHTHEMANDKILPRINKAGKYTVDSVRSQFCAGDIIEPSICVLYNPPRPSLSIDSENIFDKCAGNPIGMLVNLDFTGTPPFKVRYSVTHQGSAQPRIQQFNNMRGQLEFRERTAGSYIYQILEIEDEVYGPIDITDQNLILTQDIKPPASAMFYDNTQVTKVCLAQSTSFWVYLAGEGPWKLEYEIVHGGKRKKHSIQSQEEWYLITLPEQTEGGKYSIILTGVQDKSNCRIALKDERLVEVRPEQPRAAFGEVDGKRQVMALQGKAVKVPLRLQGTAPWTVQIKDLSREVEPVQHILKDANSVISIDHPGSFEIVSVHDTCAGIVDPRANLFTIKTIPRPELSIKETGLEPEGARTFRKPAVCMGDESALSLSLTGNAPFYIKYQQKAEPLKGPAAISNKPLTMAGSTGMVALDTSRPGHYTYSFHELGDDRYAHDKKYFQALTIKQEVYAPPSARFTNAGKTYGYCKEEPIFETAEDGGVEEIPITFTGHPPFTLEYSINHHGVSTRPETKSIRDINTKSFVWQISRSTLELGTHSISIRSVKDGRGCENVMDQDSTSVRIAVSSPPTIIPLESATDYCVGDRVSFSLSGQAPFDVFYSFQDRERKAHVSSTEFRRIAESPGQFIITGVSDSAMGAGKCRARKDIQKMIHPYPSVKISQGKTTISDIHEGGEVDIVFEFTGTPPFEFTYIRSENIKRTSRNKNKVPVILETRHDTSYEFSKTIRASDEGTYEVVAIKDRHCAYASPLHAASIAGAKAQKLLQN